MRRRGFAAALAGVAVLLASCPNPFNSILSRQAADKTPPAITLTSPQDGSTYQSTVSLQGTVSDGESGQVASLTLSVPVAEIDTNLTMGEGGEFSHSFSTAGISRAVVMTLRAKDWNGNTTELVVTLFNDDAGPGIAILSPEDASTYLSSVVVQGRIQSMTELGALTVSAAALNVVDEPIVPEADGNFTYTFSTQDISSAILARFRAVDHNGNVSSADLTLYNDGVGPFVEITEPANLSYYASVVRVSGRVLDAPGAGTTGEVKSATYRVPGTSVAGTLSLAAGGTFTFEFQTKDSQGRQLIDGTRTVEVTATDWNLNPTTASVTILRGSGGSDIPSFTVTPQSEQVTIEWEPALYATRYVLHSLRDGLIRADVASPYVWVGLANGELYSFQLQAELPDAVGADAWSDIREAIPMSERTLAPWVKEVGHRSITIEWRDMAAESEYIVEQSEAGGPWQVKTTTGATIYQATGLALETWYAYRVTPFGRQDMASAEAKGMASRFGPGGAALAATYDTPRTAFGVAAAGNYAYIADESDGLLIFDVSDPYAPMQVGGYDTTGYSYDVAVAGNFAYVADYNAGLRIIDISNPSAPSLVGTCNTLGSARGVTVAGNYAYVANETSGLQIVDISTPSAPTLVGSGFGSSFAWDVAVNGGWAYVADEVGGIKIVDVSNPAAPVGHGTYKPAGRTFGVAVAGTYAYVTDFENGLRIVNVSNPDSPSYVSTCDTPGNPFHVAVSGSRAYVADYYAGLNVIDVSNPASPRSVARVDTTSANDVAVSGSRAYVADTGSGLRVVDLSSPASPAIVGTYDTLGNAWNAAAADNLVYLADTSNGLVIFDVSVPTSPPVLVGSRDTPVQAMGVVVSGDHAFVADDGSGLQILDVSNPANPVIVGSYNTAGLAYGVAVAGDFAYVADQSAGLQIIDVSNPVAPTLASTYATAGLAWGVAAAGRYAYVAAYSGGLEIIDVSDPSSPEFVGACPTAGTAYGVAVAGNYAYVAASDRLEIIDVSNPAAPVLVQSYSTSGTAWGVTVAGSYAYVAEWGAGIEIVDVSNPASPVRAGLRDTPGNARGVAVAGSYAYVADQAAGLQVIKLGGD